MSNNVGLNVLNGVANGLNTPQLPDTNSLGLVFRRKRGVPNKAFIYSSVEEDAEIFGGSDKNLYGAEVVKLLIDNAGQATPKIYGVRIVASDAVAATASVDEPGTSLSIDLVAGYLGEEDPGVWLNGYSPKVSIASASAVTDTPYKWTLTDPNGVVVEEVEKDTFANIVAFLTNESKYVTVTGTPTPNASVPDADTSSASATTETFNSYGNQQRVIGATLPTNIVNEVIAAVTVGESVSYQGTVVGKIISVYSIETSPTTSLFSITVKLANSGVPVTPNNGGLISDLTFSTPTVSTSTTFSNGDAGTEAESDAYPTTEGLGLAALDGVYLKAVTVVDHMSVEMAVQGQIWAAANYTIYLANLPYNATDDTRELYYSTLSSANEPSIACYDFWLKVYSASQDKQVFVPSVGYVMGAGFLKAQLENGGRVHTPPAGINTAALGATDYFPKLSPAENVKINTRVRDYLVNVAVKTDGLGIYMLSSRTMSTNTLWHSIHLVIQANYYRKIFVDNLAWTLQVPITPRFDNQVVNFLTAFFGNEYDEEALENSIPFSEACIILSGSTLNPATQDRKVRNFEVQYIPTECSETVTLRINRNDGALLVS